VRPQRDRVPPQGHGARVQAGAMHPWRQGDQGLLQHEVEFRGCRVFRGSLRGLCRQAGQAQRVLEHL